MPWDKGAIINNWGKSSPKLKFKLIKLGRSDHVESQRLQCLRYHRLSCEI